MDDETLTCFTAHPADEGTLGVVRGAGGEAGEDLLALGGGPFSSPLVFNGLVQLFRPTHTAFNGPFDPQTLFTLCP